jgi:hypothetical protein
MTSAERYVSTAAIRCAVSGRELDILAGLGIQCCGSEHIHCPYPNHADDNPLWRRDVEKRRANCTCTRSESILDVICKVKGVSFEAAKIIAAEMIGRTDLIRDWRSQRYVSSTATHLLNPPAENRNDADCQVRPSAQIPIRATLVGSDYCEALGLTGYGYAPRKS